MRRGVGAAVGVPRVPVHHDDGPDPDADPGRGRCVSGGARPGPTPASGRGPVALRRVFRVDPDVTTAEADPAQTHHRGTVRQICDHLKVMCAAGTGEVLVDLQLTTDSPEEFLDLAAEFMAELA